MQALVTHVLGARPNFMKAAPVIRALGEAGVEQMLIHTGQHYDARMSDVFFTDLGMPEPEVNLRVGSGAHGEQTAAVIAGVERELMARRPALLVVYGDVNSTLGAALAAAKLHIPIAHVEAGLRSFDNTMPEEINRRLTDQLCELLFVTSPEAIGYLANEGIAPGGVHLVGNTMIDTLVACLDKLDAAAAREAYRLPQQYLVATLHRPFNVDSTEAAALLVKAMHQVADMAPVVMPVHPRGRAMFEAAGLAKHPDIRLCEPLGYLEFMSLVRGAAVAVTDSAGVQEETTFLRVPCLTLRPVTERPVTVTSGSNRLIRADELASAVHDTLAAGAYAGELPPLWDGMSGPRIARIVTGWLGNRTLSAGRGAWLRAGRRVAGIWVSSYEYESTGRGTTFTSRHYVAVIQHGTRLQVRSTPGSRSRLLMDLTANGQVLTGTWTEETNPAGYYKGAVYHGAIQMLLEPTGRKMTGKWVGFGRDFDLNTGPWTLEVLTGAITNETLSEYSKPVDD